MNESEASEAAVASSKRPQIRAERELAAWRGAPAGTALIVVWLDPAQPVRYEQAVFSSLITYVNHFHANAAVEWRAVTLTTGLSVDLHALGLVATSSRVYFTDGPGSPCFVCCAHALLAADICRQWRGALWTAVVLRFADFDTSIVIAMVLHSRGFDLGALVLRSSLLGVAATIANTVRYGRATTIGVDVQPDAPCGVRLRIADGDNGLPLRGNDTDAELERQGIQPARLVPRPKLLGGPLTAHSRDSGAAVQAVVPAQPAET